MVSNDLPLLRTSERMAYQKCRWAWWHEYVECQQPSTAAPALRFGHLIHKTLEAYYIKGSKRAKIDLADYFLLLYEKELKQAEKGGFRDADGQWNNAADLGAVMMEGYVEKYGDDERWRVLATEMPFKVPVMHPRTGKPWFYYVGIIDLVVKDTQTGFIFLVDHKTTKDDPTKQPFLTLDEQAGAYWRYGRQFLYDNGILKPTGHGLNGILFNFMKKAEPDVRKKNKEGYSLNQDGKVSKQQPGALFFRHPVFRNDAEGQRVGERVLSQYSEIRKARRRQMAIYKSPSKMNCGTCSYRDICELHESGADWKSMRNATMGEWEPYSEHELEAA